MTALATGSVGPPAMRETDVIGRSLRPPCPVALAASRLADGAIRLNWIRRSRQGWAWLDGTDVSLGEDSELYRLTLSGDGMDRVIDCVAPHFDLVAGEQSAGLLAGTSPLAVSIAQVGRFGISLPAATRTFILAGA
ncbi:hypothetical protein [Sphingomonas sp.]|uniref:hypothetical protein n=1 Tax=Sphingomonas sp. TaxID=28214 RepID=UPI000DB7D25C|nr:hypothetical protein [Sphingomonas sp.]PZU11761.1 MAG: hypothetical protein DI605_01965 [Sphingomonas sp.]